VARATDDEPATSEQEPDETPPKDKDAPPGEIAPAESDVPPPPRPASSRRIAAKTVSLDTPPEALAEATTEKRRAARRSDSSDDVDSGWGGSPPSPGLPPRPRTPRPRPGSSSPGPSSSSPASLGLGARPAKRPLAPHDTDDEATADETAMTEPGLPPGLAGDDATNTNVVAQDPTDADATAALTAQASPAVASAPPAPLTPSTPASGPAVAPGPTAPALHEEDEDDPTVVNYPQGGRDEEPTAVHPSRGPFVPPIADPAAAAAALEVSPPSSELPPELVDGDPFASREAAVQAALAAATERPSLQLSNPAREQQIVVVIATLLGIGMVLGAVGAYLTARAVAAGETSAGASLAGANVVCCISLFAAGFASLQPKEQARIGLSIASGVMLLVGFVWILAAAFS
jgi:hypothetical protein